MKDKFVHALQPQTLQDIQICPGVTEQRRNEEEYEGFKLRLLYERGTA